MNIELTDVPFISDLDLSLLGVDNNSSEIFEKITLKIIRDRGVAKNISLANSESTEEITFNRLWKDRFYMSDWSLPIDRQSEDKEV